MTDRPNDPLADALDDLQDALDQGSYQKEAREGIVSAIRKVVGHVRTLEERVEALESRG